MYIIYNTIYGIYIYKVKEPPKYLLTLQRHHTTMKWFKIINVWQLLFCILYL